MNSKKYKNFISKQQEEGEIDSDIAQKIIAMIDKQGMTREVYDELLFELAQRGKFDVFTTPYTRENECVTDGTYSYYPRNIFSAFFQWLIRGVMLVGSPIFTFFKYNIKVRGKKNLKGVKSAVTVSSHISYADSLITRTALVAHKMRIIVAPHNRKKTLGGYIMSSIVMPLPCNLAGTRVFDNALKKAVDKNIYIHFYAEKAMWLYYNKPRPIKEGAAHYACKLNIPMIPMTYVVKKPCLLRRMLGFKHDIVVRIGEPIYPDKNLSVRENTKQLTALCSQARLKLHQDELDRTPDKRKI